MIFFKEETTFIFLVKKMETNILSVCILRAEVLAALAEAKCCSGLYLNSFSCNWFL